MTRQKQTSEGQSKQKNRPSPKNQPASSSLIGQTPLHDSTAYLAGLLAETTIQAQAARLHDPRLPATQRQAMAAQIGRVRGNQYLQRVVAAGKRAPSVQRYLTMLGTVTSLKTLVLQATEAELRAQEESRINAVVTEQIEQALAEFQAIPIKITYKETTTDGEGNITEVERTTIVHVHPPYFRNVKSEKRYKDAIKNRRGSRAYQRAITAGYKTMKDQGLPKHGGFKTGKSHPSQIKAILEAAVRQGSVKKKSGALHPDSDDLRDWLIRYGIGVDCSGFVGFALNKVLASLETEAADLPPGEGETQTAGRLSTSHATYTDQAKKKFNPVTTPDDLRPGDVMGVGKGSPHVRIVLSTQKEGAAVVFETAESSSGSGELATGGTATGNVGPRRRRWRFPDSGRMDGLQKWNQNEETWQGAGADNKAMAFGRAKLVAESSENIISTKSRALVTALFERSDEAIATANKAGE